MLNRRQFLGFAVPSLLYSIISKSSIVGQEVNSNEIILTEEALRIHRSALVVDGHNDLVYSMHQKGLSSFDSFDLRTNQPEFHTDIPRLLKGGIGAQFWVADGSQMNKQANEKSSLRYCLEDIELIHKMTEMHPDVFELAYNAENILKIHEKGKIASLIGIEGGFAIEGSLNVLDSFYRLGARYMTLTWGETNDLADSATDTPKHGGLSETGKKVVIRMNQLGMLVDISHVTADTMRDVLNLSEAPIIASHSSVYNLSNSDRNIPDDILVGIAKNGGLIMVNFFPGFLTHEGAKIDKGYWDYLHLLQSDPEKNSTEIENLLQNWDNEHPVPMCSVEKVVDHIDHIVKTAGLEHVGLGSDFDGIPVTPDYLKDVSYFPYITQILLNRGYKEEEIRKILGGNFMRVFKKVEGMT